VDNLITNKSVATLEASRRILDAKCANISVLANVKNFKNTMTLCVINTSHDQGVGHVALHKCIGHMLVINTPTPKN